MSLSILYIYLCWWPYAVLIEVDGTWKIDSTWLHGVGLCSRVLKTWIQLCIFKMRVTLLAHIDEFINTVYLYWWSAAVLIEVDANWKIDFAWLHGVGVCFWVLKIWIEHSIFKMWVRITLLVGKLAHIDECIYLSVHLCWWSSAVPIEVDATWKIIPHDCTELLYAPEYSKRESNSVFSKCES
jgi:hypothetical protein